MLRCSRRRVLLPLYSFLRHLIRCVSVWYTIWLRRRFARRRLAETRALSLRGRGRTLAQRLAHQGDDIGVWLQRSKARHGPGVGKVPLVFRDTDKVSNGGVAGPGAPERGLGQFGGDPGLQNRAKVAARRNTVERRQAGEIDRGWGSLPLALRWLRRGGGGGGGSGRRALRIGGGIMGTLGAILLLALEPRPARQKWLRAIFRPGHDAPSPPPRRLPPGRP